MAPFQEYINYGWKLCRIEPGSKGPKTLGWNLQKNALKSAEGIKAAGLMHVYSGTCAFDIDDLIKTSAYLLERGIELSDLLLAEDAVQISSGRPNRGKLLYAMSEPLSSKSFAEGAFELRCGTSSGKSAQDVLPPSPHPSGGIYQWIGNWQKLPSIPESLLTLWRGDQSQHNNDARLLSSGQQNRRSEILALLSSRDPNCGYKEWIDIGMAIHHATNGSEEGLRLWDEWSSGRKDKV